MSKKGRQHRSRTPSRRRKQPPRNSASFAIPVVVGLTVLTIIVGTIVLIENRRPAATSQPGYVSASNQTAQPLPTRPIPYPNVPRIFLQEAQDRLEQSQAILVDIRSRASYNKTHAAGAISIPEEEVDARLDELPRDRGWILY